MANVTYEIKSTIAILSKSAKGWTKELNLISWNGAEPKYDIRDWAPDHEKMGKGITLNTDEIHKLIMAFIPEEVEEVEVPEDDEEVELVESEELEEKPTEEVKQDVVDLDEPEAEVDPLLEKLPPELRAAVLATRGGK